MVIWYRVYSDGWLEQGGRNTIQVQIFNVNLLKPYENTNYISVGIQCNTENAGFHTINVASFSTTQVQLRQQPIGYPIINWYTCGY